MKTATANTKSLFRLNYHAPVILCVILIVVLILLPSGFENLKVYGESDLRPAKVIDVDDSAIVDTGLIRSGEKIRSISMIDHYRIHWEILLAGLFFVLLILFAGRTGVRAILSFALTVRHFANPSSRAKSIE